MNAATELTFAEPTQITLGALAKKCLFKSRNDLDRAAILFVKEIKQTPGLQTQLLEQSARYFLRQAQSNIRRQIERNADAPSVVREETEGLSGIAEVTKGWLSSWLDGYVLPTNDKLGDADRAILKQSRKLYQADINKLQHDDKFLAAISKRLSVNGIVRDCLTEEQIAEIWSSFS